MPLTGNFKIVNGAPFELELLVLHRELFLNSSPIDIIQDLSNPSKYKIQTNNKAKNTALNQQYLGMDIIQNSPIDYELRPNNLALSNAILNTNKAIEAEFFVLRASEISQTLERYWEVFNANINLGTPFYFPFNHLGYSFLFENTKVFEIFRKVTEQYVNGEALTHPTIEAARWLQNTTKLMFNDEPIYSNFLVTSQISNSEDVVRRNAYKRLFGVDLSHAGQLSQYPQSNINNDEFFKVFGEFLKLSWTGAAEYTNTSGTNYTETDRIKNLADDLKSMLLSRRTVENSLDNYEYLDLSAIEFKAHLRARWFYHALSYNSPIVRELSCEGTSIADRIQKIAKKVGDNSHSKTSSFVEFAPLFGFFCRALELDMVTDLYVSSMLTPGTASNKHVMAMINLYEATTGVGIKHRMRA